MTTASTWNEAACPRCACGLEAGDLRCAVCGLSVPADAALPEVARANVLRCHTCGASVRYDIEVQAPRCAFCGAVAHVERPTDPMERPRVIFPFVVQPEQAQQAMRAWLGTLGWFRPSDLATEARIASMRPLWWVAWIFDARALVSWTADSNAGARRSAWAPHAGQTSMEFESILVPASRGLNAKECEKLTRYFSLGRTIPAFTGPPGAVCESFSVQRSAARETVTRAIEAVARERVAQHIPGTRVRKAKVAVLLEGLKTRRCAMPTYVLSYRYEGKLYRALVHGQDASCVFGMAPYSLAKIVLAVVAVAGAVFLALLLLLLFLALAAH